MAIRNRILKGATKFLNADGTWKKHKYLKKVDGKYFYTIDEIKAYGAKITRRKEDNNPIKSNELQKTNSNKTEMGVTAREVEGLLRAVHTTIVAANSTVRSKFVKLGSDFVTKLIGKKYDQPEKVSDLKKQTPPPTSPEEDVNLINKEYDAGHEVHALGPTTNCAWCTTAYDLRQRGYDVVANDITSDVHNTIDEIESWYVDGKFKNVKDFVDENGTLNDVTGDGVYDQNDYFASVFYEEGAFEKGAGKQRYQMCVTWTNENGDALGGHSIVCETNSEDGSIMIKDCQTHTEYTYDEWFNTYNAADIWHFRNPEGKIYPDAVQLMRIDNKEINENSKVLKGVRNRT